MKGNNMNNLKKIGLTALGTVLVASSANAADITMSATSKITYVGADNGDDGNGFSMSDSISFSTTGEMDNGMTITHGIELDGAAIDANSIAINTGDMGTLTFVGGGTTGVITQWDDLTPNANEEANGVPYNGTASAVDGGGAQTHNLFIYDYTITDGLELKASYAPSGLTAAVEGSTEYGIKYTGIDGLTVYAAMGENNDAAAGIDNVNFAAIYTAGAMSVGFQANDIDHATASSDRDATILGVSYAVSDDLSVSLNTSTVEHEDSTKDDQEATAVSFSYTSGGMTISGTYGSMDNVGGTGTIDNNAYELNFGFAF
jgi:outer membrane protein OmpU